MYANKIIHVKEKLITYCGNSSLRSTLKSINLARIFKSHTLRAFSLSKTFSLLFFLIAITQICYGSVTLGASTYGIAYETINNRYDYDVGNYTGASIVGTAATSASFIFSDPASTLHITLGNNGGGNLTLGTMSNTSEGFLNPGSGIFIANADNTTTKSLNLGVVSGYISLSLGSNVNFNNIGSVSLNLGGTSSNQFENVIISEAVNGVDHQLNLTATANVNLLGNIYAQNPGSGQLYIATPITSASTRNVSIKGFIGAGFTGATDNRLSKIIIDSPVSNTGYIGTVQFNGVDPSGNNTDVVVKASTISLINQGIADRESTVLFAPSSGKNINVTGNFTTDSHLKGNLTFTPLGAVTTTVSGNIGIANTGLNTIKLNSDGSNVQSFTFQGNIYADKIWWNNSTVGSTLLFDTGSLSATMKMYDPTATNQIVTAFTGSGILIFKSAQNQTYTVLDTSLNANNGYRDIRLADTNTTLMLSAQSSDITVTTQSSINSSSANTGSLILNAGNGRTISMPVIGNNSPIQNLKVTGVGTKNLRSITLGNSGVFTLDGGTVNAYASNDINIGGTGPGQQGVIVVSSNTNLYITAANANIRINDSVGNPGYLKIYSGSKLTTKPNNQTIYANNGGIIGTDLSGIIQDNAGTLEVYNDSVSYYPVTLYGNIGDSKHRLNTVLFSGTGPTPLVLRSGTNYNVGTWSLGINSYVSMYPSSNLTSTGNFTAPSGNTSAFISRLSAANVTHTHIGDIGTLTIPIDRISITTINSYFNSNFILKGSLYVNTAILLDGYNGYYNNKFTFDTAGIDRVIKATNVGSTPGSDTYNLYNVVFKIDSGNKIDVFANLGNVYNMNTLTLVNGAVAPTNLLTGTSIDSANSSKITFCGNAFIKPSSNTISIPNNFVVGVKNNGGSDLNFTPAVSAVNGSNGGLIVETINDGIQRTTQLSGRIGATPLLYLETLGSGTANFSYALNSMALGNNAVAKINALSNIFAGGFSIGTGAKVNVGGNTTFSGAVNVGDSSTFTVGSTTGFNNILTMGQNNTLTLNSASTFSSGITMGSGGVLRIASGSMFNGAINMGNNANFIVQSDGTTFNSTITVGSNSNFGIVNGITTHQLITVGQNSSVNLLAQSTLSGGMTLNNGVTLTIGAANSSIGNLSFGNSGRMNVNYNTDFAGTVVFLDNANVTLSSVATFYNTLSFGAGATFTASQGAVMGGLVTLGNNATMTINGLTDFTGGLTVGNNSTITATNIMNFNSALTAGTGLVIDTNSNMSFKGGINAGAGAVLNVRGGTTYFRQDSTLGGNTNIGDEGKVYIYNDMGMYIDNSNVSVKRNAGSPQENLVIMDNSTLTLTANGAKAELNLNGGTIIGKSGSPPVFGNSGTLNVDVTNGPITIIANIGKSINEPLENFEAEFGSEAEAINVNGNVYVNTFTDINSVYGSSVVILGTHDGRRTFAIGNSGIGMDTSSTNYYFGNNIDIRLTGVADYATLASRMNFDDVTTNTLKISNNANVILGTFGSINNVLSELILGSPQTYSVARNTSTEFITRIITDLEQESASGITLVYKQDSQFNSNNFEVGSESVKFGTLDLRDKTNNVNYSSTLDLTDAKLYAQTIFLPHGPDQKITGTNNPDNSNQLSSVIAGTVNMTDVPIGTTTKLTIQDADVSNIAFIGMHDAHTHTGSSVEFTTASVNNPTVLVSDVTYYQEVKVTGVNMSVQHDFSSSKTTLKNASLEVSGIADLGNATIQDSTLDLRSGTCSATNVVLDGEVATIRTSVDSSGNVLGVLRIYSDGSVVNSGFLNNTTKKTKIIIDGTVGAGTNIFIHGNLVNYTGGTTYNRNSKNNYVIEQGFGNYNNYTFDGTKITANNSVNNKAVQNTVKIIRRVLSSPQSIPINNSPQQQTNDDTISVGDLAPAATVAEAAEDAISAYKRLISNAITNSNNAQSEVAILQEHKIMLNSGFTGQEQLALSIQQMFQSPGNTAVNSSVFSVGDVVHETVNTTMFSFDFTAPSTSEVAMSYLHNDLNLSNEYAMAKIEERIVASSGSKDIKSTRSGLWIKAFKGSNSQKTVSSVPAHDSKMQGVMMGFDTKISDNFILGTAISRGNTGFYHGQFKSKDKTNIEGVIYSIYSSYKLGNGFIVNLSGSIGKNQINYKSQRVTGLNKQKTVIGSYIAKSLYGSINIAHRYVKNKFIITPTIGLSFDSFGDESYSETGAGIYDMKFNTTSSVKTSGKISLSIAYDNGLVVPEIHFGLKQKLSGKMPKTTYSFVNSNVDYNSIQPEDNHPLFSFGGKLGLKTQNLDLGIGIDWYMSSNYNGTRLHTNARLKL